MRILVLQIRLDGDTPEAVAEYGNQLMDSFAELKKQDDASIVFDIKAEQLLGTQMVVVDDPVMPTRFGGPGGV